MTEEQIRELEELEQKATPGPWALLDDTDDFTGFYVESLSHPQRHQLIICKMQNGEREGFQDCAFIAALRNNAKVLLSSAKREKALEDGLRMAVEWFDVQCPAHMVPVGVKRLKALLAEQEEEK